MDRKSFLNGIATLPIAVELAAKPRTEIAGNWIGTLSYGGDTQSIALAIKAGKDGKPTAYFWNSALGIYGMPFSHVKQTSDGVRLMEAKLVLHYDGTALRGTLSPIGDKIELTRATSPLPPAPAAPSPVTGDVPKMRWQMQIGPVWNAPLVVGSRIYAGDAKGVLHAIDGASGSTLWTYETGAGLFGTAAGDGTALLLLDGNDTLHRIDAANGKRVWAKSLGAGKPHDVPSLSSRQFDYRSATPLVDDGVAYVGSGSGEFYAIEAGSGDVRWRHRESSAIRSTAAIAAGRVIFGTWSGDVVALDSAGTTVWRLRTKQPISMGVVCYQRIAIAGSRNSLLYGISIDTGRPVWARYDFASWVESSPTIVDDVAYIGSSDLHAVRAFDPATGRVRWNKNVYGWSWGTPLVRAGVVYAGTGSMAPYIPGMLSGRWALRASDGMTMWRDTAPPVKGRITGYACGPVATQEGAIVYASMSGAVQCIS